MGLAAVLAGCGLFQRPERPAWRGQAEAVCLAEKRVQQTAYLRMAPAIDGPGICGLDHPLRSPRWSTARVRLANPAATLGCPMVVGLEQWLTTSVQPAAMRDFGRPVAARASSRWAPMVPLERQYPRRQTVRAAFGNAMDVGGFIVGADGREIT